jgi:hypothetical protein
MKKLFVTLVLAIGAACTDPTLQKQMDAIPDDTQHRDGPEHHPGYQCTACHTEFSLGGTVYQDGDGKTPAEGAIVTLTDAIGDVHSFSTNSVGNFYEEKDRWDPRYPISVAVQYTDPRDGKAHKNTMETTIGREGGCAFCHKIGGRAQDAPSPVYGANQL